MQHFRLAWRSLRRRPTYAAMSTLILALGIGTSTAIYTTASAVLLKPLPYNDPDRVVFLWDNTPEAPLTNLSPARLVEYRARVKGLTLAGIGHLSVTMTGRGLAERLNAASVSANFFDVLGASPLVGRVFHAGEHDRARVVLSEGLWRRRFGADPHINEQALTLDGRLTTIAGVMPASFFWPTVTARPNRAAPPEIWLLAPENDLPALPGPYKGDLSRDRTLGYLRAVGRLAPGVSLNAAQAEVAAVAHQMRREHPLTDRNRGAVIVSAREQLLGHMRLPIALLLGGAALVLLGACLNAANLQLIRYAGSARELRIHTALGAGRRVVAANLLAETLTISAIAATLGACLGTAMLRLLLAVAPLNVPRLDTAGVNTGALVFAAAIAGASGVLIALVPLWRLRRQSGIASAERAPSSRLSSRSGHVLVATEVATAVVLVCGAMLFARSLARVQHVDVGIADMDHLLTFDLALTGPRRQAGPAANARFYAEVLARLRAVPGVRRASAAGTLPIGGDNFGTSIVSEGSTPATSEEGLSVGYQVVASDWFATLGVPLLEGRTFSESDDGQHGAVAIVNRTLAARLWPGSSAVGRRVRRGNDEAWMTIVGVVGDLRHLGPMQSPRPEIYEPMGQQAFSFAAFAARVAGEPSSYVDVFRREIALLDPSQALSNVKTMGEHLRGAQAESRALSGLTALFGWLALIISALGIYSAVGFSVAQRLREFGVRLALGASPHQVAGQVLRETMLTAGAGIAIGLAAALAAGRGIQALLFETAPADVPAYASTALVLAVVAALIGCVPARSAMRADPASILRSD